MTAGRALSWSSLSFLDAALKAYKDLCGAGGVTRLGLADVHPTYSATWITVSLLQANAEMEACWQQLRKVYLEHILRSCCQDAEVALIVFWSRGVQRCANYGQTCWRHPRFPMQNNGPSAAVRLCWNLRGGRQTSVTSSNGWTGWSCREADALAALRSQATQLHSLEYWRVCFCGVMPLCSPASTALLTQQAHARTLVLL